MKKVKFTLYVLLMSLLFWQCSSDLEKANLSGSAVKGGVVSAEVTVYAYDGTRGEVLVNTTTDQSGNFSVEIDHRGVVEVVVTGGNYKDEATGQQVSVGTFELRSIINVDGDEHFGITALTTIAAEHIDEHAQDGLNTAIENANREVANAFGLSGIDISTVIPADLSLSESANANMDQAKYGAIQAGLSEFINANGLSPQALLDLIEAMGADFSDGVFDGMSGSEALNLAISITPADAADGLQTAVENFLNGSKNASGFTPLDIFG